jgi:hypothetical protein
MPDLNTRDGDSKQVTRGDLSHDDQQTNDPRTVQDHSENAANEEHPMSTAADTGQHDASDPLNVLAGVFIEDAASSLLAPRTSYPFESSSRSQPLAPAQQVYDMIGRSITSRSTSVATHEGAGHDQSITTRSTNVASHVINPHSEERS